MEARLLFGQWWKEQDIPKRNELINKIYEVAEMDFLTIRIGDGNIQKVGQSGDRFMQWINDVI